MRLRAARLGADGRCAAGPERGDAAEQALAVLVGLGLGVLARRRGLMGPRAQERAYDGHRVQAQEIVPVIAHAYRTVFEGPTFRAV
jgi:hypothetical protein